MSEVGLSDDIDFGVSQKLYVVGDHVKISAALRPLSSISVEAYPGSIARQVGEHFILYLLSGHDETSWATMANLLAHEQSILTRKILWLIGEKAIAPSLQRLASELRVDKILAGEGAFTQLQQYLNEANEQACLVGTLAGYKAELVQTRGSPDQEASIKLLRRIDLVCPPSDDKTYTLASGYNWVQQTGSAIALLRQALVAKPEALWAALFLAELYLQINKPDYAVEILQRLNQVHTLNPYRSWLLGEIYRRCGRLQDALPPLELGCQLTQGKERRFIEALVKVNAGLGRYERALSLLQGKAPNPHELATLCEHSLMAFGRQDYQQGVLLLEAVLPAVAQQPVLAAKVQYNLALGALALGQAQKAQAYMKAYATQPLAQNPEIARLAQSLHAQPIEAKQLLSQFKPLPMESP